MFRKHIFKLIIILYFLPVIQNTYSQDKVIYTYSPISIGVNGGLNLSYYHVDDFNTRNAKLPYGGFNITINPAKKLQTRLSVEQVTNGINTISPLVKIRNFYIDFQIVEYFSFTKFAKAGIGIKYAIPLYSIEKTPTDIKQKINRHHQVNPLIAIELALSQNFDLNFKYSFLTTKSIFNSLQIGIIYWLVNGYNTKYEKIDN